MTLAEIITATVIVLRGQHARVCAECGRPITVRALRVAEKRDGLVAVFYYHDAVEEDDEIRACAPRHPKVLAALRRTVPATVPAPHHEAPPIDHGGDDPYGLQREG